MNYSFILRLQDLMSGPLARVSATYSRSVSQWEGLTRRFQSSFSRAAQSVEQLKRKFSFGRESASVDGLRTKLEALTKRRDLSVNTSEIKAANREIDQLQKQMDKLQGKKGGGGSSGGLMAMAAPYVGAAMLATGIGAFAKSGMDREQTKVAFEQFVGKQGVDPMMNQLNKFADVTPYSNEDVYGAGRTLLSAKVDPKFLNATMTQIGNMAAVSQKDFGELSSAYAKIKQKGFADSGELHQEFGGTAVMDQLKKDLGVNGEQLFKLAEQRKIRFEDIQTSIENLSEKGGLYEGGLEKLSNTAGGKWSTFLGTLQNKITTWAEKLNPLLSKAFDFGTSLLGQIDPLLAKLQPVFDVVVNGVGQLWAATEPVRDLLSDLWNWVVSLVSGFGGLAGGTSGLTVLFDVLAAVVWTVSTGINWLGSLLLWLADSPLVMLIAVIWGATYAWGALNAVIMANPFAAVIVGIVAIVAALRYAWQHFDGFREGIIRTWAVIKSIFSSMGQVLLAVVMPTPENIANAMTAVKGGFGAAVAAGDAAVKADRASRQAVKAEKIAKAAAGPVKPGVPGAGGVKPMGAGDVGKAGGASASVGGAKSTSITINLKSLVERLEIHASGVQEGIGNMEEQVQDALLRVLNSANSMAT